MNVNRSKPLQDETCAFRSDEFSWIQNVIRVEHLLEPAMKVPRNITRGLWPPAFFRETNSVFTRNYTAQREHLPEEIVESALNFFPHSSVAIVAIGHNVDVNVAIPGVAETGDRKSILCLQFVG